MLAYIVSSNSLSMTLLRLSVSRVLEVVLFIEQVITEFISITRQLGSEENARFLLLRPCDTFLQRLDVTISAPQFHLFPKLSAHVGVIMM